MQEALGRQSTGDSFLHIESLDGDGRDSAAVNPRRISLLNELVNRASQRIEVLRLAQLANAYFDEAVLIARISFRQVGNMILEIDAVTALIANAANVCGWEVIPCAARPYVPAGETVAIAQAPVGTRAGVVGL